MTHDELLASIERMTNEELIAKAKELCEQQIADHTPRESWTVKNYPAYWLAHYQTTLNSWTTHLAEMDEHYNNFVEGNYNLAESVEGWFCQGCYERNDSDTPCHKLVTKAKRLLGVRSE